MPDRTVTNEFDTGVDAGVWPRMVQVEHVKAHVRRNNRAQAAVTCIAQQANIVGAVRTKAQPAGDVGLCSFAHDST